MTTDFMPAARLQGPKAIGVTSQTVPAPGAAEVRVRVEVCGVCGTDLHFFTGRWPQPAFTLGHEFSGVVTAVGEDAAPWRVGDKVCVEPVLSCGRCRACRRGENNLCSEFRFLSIHLDGGMAEQAIVPVKCLHAIPEGMSASRAALAEPLAVAIHACRVGGVKAGDTVVVCGAGSIGLLTAAAAGSAGAAEVIVSGRHPHQQEAANSLGARGVAPDDLEAAVAAATDGEGADVIIETVGGAGQAVGQALAAVRPGGTVVLVGGFTRPASVHLWRVVSRESRVLGAYCYNHAHAPTDFERALQLLSEEGDDLERLITHRLPLSEVCEAFGLALDKSSHAIKVQMLCSDP